MALEIRRTAPAASSLVADRHLYLTRDKEQVVEAGDPKAGYLFATPGMVLLQEDVQRYGLDLVDGVIVVGADPVEDSTNASDGEAQAEAEAAAPARRTRASRRG